LGTPTELLTREREITGQLWGRLQQVQTLTRLRGPLEPMLGTRDVPPYDGVILLFDQGLGFVPTSPPNPEELFPTLRDLDPDHGPLGAWWTEVLDAAAVPPALRDARAIYRLPLSLRARLDPTAAWIGLGTLARLELRGLELRAVVDGAGDAVCRVPADAPELLGDWGAQFDVTLQDRGDEGVTQRVRGWLRRD